jgi:hypothetical protein
MDQLMSLHQLVSNAIVLTRRTDDEEEEEAVEEGEEA